MDQRQMQQLLLQKVRNMLQSDVDHSHDSSNEPHHALSLTHNDMFHNPLALGNTLRLLTPNGENPDFSHFKTDFEETELVNSRKQYQREKRRTSKHRANKDSQETAENEIDDRKAKTRKVSGSNNGSFEFNGIDPALISPNSSCDHLPGLPPNMEFPPPFMPRPSSPSRLPHLPSLLNTIAASASSQPSPSTPTQPSHHVLFPSMHQHSPPSHQQSPPTNGQAPVMAHRPSSSQHTPMEAPSSPGSPPANFQCGPNHANCTLPNSPQPFFTNGKYATFRSQPCSHLPAHRNVRAAPELELSQEVWDYIHQNNLVNRVNGVMTLTQVSISESGKTVVVVPDVLKGFIQGSTVPIHNRVVVFPHLKLNKKTPINDSCIMKPEVYFQLKFSITHIPFEPVYSNSFKIIAHIKQHPNYAPAHKSKQKGPYVQSHPSPRSSSPPQPITRRQELDMRPVYTHNSPTMMVPPVVHHGPSHQPTSPPKQEQQPAAEGDDWITQDPNAYDFWRENYGTAATTGASTIFFIEKLVAFFEGKLHQPVSRSCHQHLLQFFESVCKPGHEAGVTKTHFLLFLKYFGPLSNSVSQLQKVYGAS